MYHQAFLQIFQQKSDKPTLMYAIRHKYRRQCERVLPRTNFTRFSTKLYYNANTPTHTSLQFYGFTNRSFILDLGFEITLF